MSEQEDKGPKEASGSEEEAAKGKWRPRALPLILAVAFGMFLGSSLFVLNYAEGLAYLSNDPAACTNCHIMQPQYDGWEKSPHHAVATCNDCHTPHNIIQKYIAKARNGWNHSTAFTFENFEEPIRIKPTNAAILNENCLRCHEDFVNQITGHYGDEDSDLLCVNCHRSVGHGPTR